MDQLIKDELIAYLRNQHLNKLSKGFTSFIGGLAAGLSQGVTETKLYKEFKQHSLFNKLLAAKKSESLSSYIRRVAHERGKIVYNAALFEQADIQRHYWSKVLNGKEFVPSKDKLLRIAILLQMNKDETYLLLEKAGYAVAPNNPDDAFLMFFIEEQIYDFIQIQEALEDPTIQSLLKNMA